MRPAGPTSPIFIVGTGRSGTTLVRTLLSAHSRIAVPPETHFMKAAAACAPTDDAGPEAVERLIRSYAAGLRFRDLGVAESRWLALLDEAPVRDARAAFAALLRTYGERIGKPRIGEKTPGHIAFVPRLLRWFPDARIIAMRRDPRAVIASQLKSPWMAPRIRDVSLRHGLFLHRRRTQVARQARRWAEIYSETVPAWSDDARVLVQDYESLVQAPEAAVQRLCAFLDEAYEPAMLARRTDDVAPAAAATDDMSDARWRAWRREHHARSLEPVSDSGLHKWRAELSPREVAVIEAFCLPVMLRAGYEPVSSAAARRAARLEARALAVAERTEERLRAMAGQVQRDAPAATPDVRPPVT